MGNSLKQTLLLLGGFIGFAVCFATGFVAGHDIGQTLLNASIGCIVGAYLFKWLASLIVDCMVQRKRAVNAAAAMAAKNEAAKGAAK